MRSPDHSSDRAPLLALVNATAEWHAGLPGTCSASVRLLDRVHFTVYRGDCVVVHHDDPASARVLLAALGGHHAAAVSRQWQGQRLCGPGVRIRRCSIPAAAVSALQSGWQQLAAAEASECGTQRGVESVVHLLRASRHTGLSMHERAQWHGWAHRVRVSGGALVIVAPGTPLPALVRAAPPRLDAGTGDRLRERAGAAYAPAETDARTQALWLRHGRLCNLRAWE
jgi:hypothetical protein